MSSEFLEHLEPDENDHLAALSMNAHGYAWLSVYTDASCKGDVEYYQSVNYALAPNEKGWKAAEGIAAALTEWVRHTKSIHQPEGK